MVTAFRRFLQSTYGGLPAVTWLICVAAFVNRAGAMVLPFLSLYLLRRFGLDVQQAGFLVSLYGIGSVLGNLVGGKLTDVLGPVRVQLVTLTAAALWMWTMTQFTTLWLLGPGIFVLGLLNDSFRPGNMSAILASVPPHLGPLALTLNRVFVNAGWAIGPTIGGHLAKLDYDWLFVADGATCALAALVLWWKVPIDLGDAHQLEHRKSVAAAKDAGVTIQSDRSPWHDGKFLLLLLANVITLLAFMQYFSTESRYLEATFACDEEDIGNLLAINPLLIVLLEMPLVRSLRGRAPLPFVAFGTFLIGLAFLLLVPAHWAMPGVIAQMVLLTVGEMFSFSPLGGFVGDRASSGRRGQYLGLHGAAFSFAFVLAPTLGGMTYKHLGADALWYGCFVLATISTLGYLALHRVYRRADAGTDG
ncbi:MAG: MFS transporter [Planctomycetota bacterium]